MSAGLLSLVLLGISASADALPDLPDLPDEFAIDFLGDLDPELGPVLLPGKGPAQKPPRTYLRLRAYRANNGPVSPRNPKADAALGGRVAEPPWTGRPGGGSHATAATAGAPAVPRIYLFCILLV